MKNVTLAYSITPGWEFVKEIENRIRNTFCPENVELLDSSAMTMSELVENAVKYGGYLKNRGLININFTADERFIIIIVSNPVEEQNHVDMVKKHITNISNSNDRQTLYIERLHVLLQNSQNKKKTQLGLYRIAYEGKFDLSYTFENKVLSVKAIRKLV